MDDHEIERILAEATEPLVEDARRRGRSAIEAALAQAAAVGDGGGSVGDGAVVDVVDARPVPMRSTRRWFAVVGAAALAAAAVVAIVLVRRDPGDVTVTGTDPTSATVASPVSGPVATGDSISTSDVPSTSTSTETSTSTAPSTTEASASPITAPATAVAVAHATPPTGVRAYSVSFPSVTEGWVVGTNAATSARVFAHTADGGQTWNDVAVPADLAGDDGLFTVTFADATNGWLIGPGDVGSGILLSTHDGGATWVRVTLAIASATPTDLFAMAISTANGFAHLIALERAAGSNVIALWTSAVGSDGFTRSPLEIQPGAGPRFDASSAYGGGSGWMIYNDRVVSGAARLVDGQWTEWAAPCSDPAHPYDTGLVSASPDGSEVVVACSTSGFGSAPFSARLYRSVDGGATFTETTPLPLALQQGDQPPAPSIAFVDVPSTGVILVGYARTDGVVSIDRSGDAGGTWTEVQRLPADTSLLTYHVAAGTLSPAFVVATGEDSGLSTVDGGLTWFAVTSTPIVEGASGA